jgi:DNA repair exonuclease SbcCD ATPase subunit
MGNENYMNHYVEILTSTMQDVIVRNISLQANAKISENIIGDQMKKNEDLILKVNNLSDEIEKTKEFNLQSESEKVKNLENTINGHLDRIKDVENQLVNLSGIKSEYENAKQQLNHLETFRNELVKTQEELKNLHGNHEKSINDLRGNHEKSINDLNEELKNLRGNHEKTISDLNNSHKLIVKELTDKIDYLQLTPTKKRKIEDASMLKDGGSF